jgi:transposase
LQGRGYAGGYTILTDWLRPQRECARVAAVRRFETAPGEQAQVDWGHLGGVEMSGQVRQLWGFTFTLGYSRMMMAEAALDQKLGTLLRMHEEAFRQLGGVPREILYDRMKTIWQGTDERGEIVWNPVFVDFARYWGFTPRLCRPGRPLGRAQTKGKVESGVKYVRRNSLCGLLGREPGTGEDLNIQLRQWIWEVANQRVHGTTHEPVIARWEADRLALQPLDGRPICMPARSCARRRATLLCTGRGAATRYRGSMPASRCGCASRWAGWRCATARSASPTTRWRGASTWS